MPKQTDCTTNTILYSNDLIKQYFNRDLLTRPHPKFQDTSAHFHCIRKYIDYKLCRKGSACHPNRKNKIAKLIQEYDCIYERTQAKEKELKGTSKDPNERPFYYVTISSGFLSEVLRRVRNRMYTSDSFKRWKNNGVSKVSNNEGES